MGAVIIPLGGVPTLPPEPAWREVNRAAGELTASGSCPVYIGHVGKVHTSWTTEAQQSPRLSSASNLPDGTDQPHNISASVSLSVKSKCSPDLWYPNTSLQAGGKAFPSN